MKKLTKSAIAATVLLSPQVVDAAPVLSPTDFVIAIDRDAPLSLSNSPDAERASNALDGDPGTKYLNFGKLDTGILITPIIGATTIKSMQLWTANDYASRDPASWAIAGTNDPIDHIAANNGTSVLPGVTWTPIASGNVAMPGTLPGGGGDPSVENNGRFEAGPILAFGANNTAYTSYRILFPTVKAPNGLNADSMQVSEINLFPAADGSGGNLVSVVDGSSAFQLPKPDSRASAAEGAIWALDGAGPNPNLPSQSNHPGGEPPANVVDGTNNKYLNFGKEDTGFIVTPAGGSSQVRSFQLTTANDAEARDPGSWQLFGTNSAIASVNNSYGTAEPWTLIDQGALALPAGRTTLGAVVPVNNAASYSSYKMVFPTLKDSAGANSMQIGEASFFASTDGSGADLLNIGDPIIAIDGTPRSGLESKYLNLGENNSGLIVTPSAGPKVVTSLQITTANDAVERDPATFEIYGTNDAITSIEHSQGDAENWTIISTGALDLPAERLTQGSVISFPNTTSYKSFRIVFPTVKDATAANSMQISGLQLFDSAAAENADFNADGIVDGKDFLAWQRGFGSGTTLAQGDANGSGTVDAADLVIWKAKFGTAGATVAAGAVPEPATGLLGLVGMALAGLAARREKRRKA